MRTYTLNGLISCLLGTILYFCTATACAAVLWDEVNISPYVESRFRTLYDWHSNGVVTDVPNIETVNGLASVQKPNNFIQFETTAIGAQLSYRFVQMKVGLFDHRIVGGDVFSLDDLELSESYIFIGPEWPVRIVLGRQKFRLGHEIVAGFNEWSASPEFYDSANLIVVLEPFELEVFNAKLMDKSALMFLTLKEQLIWQPYIATNPNNFLFMDMDFRGAALKFAPFRPEEGREEGKEEGKEDRLWLQAYWVHYFNLNAFVPFREFAFIKTVGLAHHIEVLPWLEINGEAAYQYGSYTRQLSHAAAAAYEQLKFPLTFSGWTLTPRASFWIASGDETVLTSLVSGGQPGTGEPDLSAFTDGKYAEFIFIRPDYHGHLGLIDLFGLSNILSVELGIETGFRLFREHAFRVGLAGLSFFIQNLKGTLRNADGFVITHAPQGGPNRHVGNELDFSIGYTYDVLSFDFIFGVFIPGSYAQAHFWKHDAGKPDPDTVSLLVLDVSVKL